jgi:uncharacterized protein
MKKFLPIAICAMSVLLPAHPLRAQEPAGSGAAAPSAMVPADQQPTKEQLAKLFETMRIRETISSYFKVLPMLMKQQINAQMQQIASMSPSGRLTDEQREMAQRSADKYLQKAMDSISIDDMLGDMATVYQRHLSRTDVDAMIAFYSSDAGQHFLTQQPAIMAEYQPMAMKRVTETTRKLTEEMMKDLQGGLKPDSPSKGSSSTAAPAQN